ncbi:heme-binding protein [Magnetospirillum sp. 64-120]|uniref:GlcG/HbpS family heme-binding protein n=1 Tax=Magnetospirillum sp. 64-120 TaxID=1895778 RepID=UPI0009269231|nr:heme-binding protein [Magnetospirillum sp. 64-120]OJX77709.1 MAG: hypothetical protein BGO92_00770 [Magnetospirillum sp. 64-120]
MTEEQAVIAVSAGIAKAKEMGVRVTVAAVDAGGHAKALIRMDGAPFHSVTFATDKARTSAGFGTPTALWKDRIGGRPHVLTGLNGREGFMPVGGGVPVLADQATIGAIGVSGAKEEEDCEIAAAALTAIGLSLA